ncbi:MAG TPA: hypothetical protein P5044_07375 [bacterium]|nr:hypothetical protein [bacterium]
MKNIFVFSLFFSVTLLFSCSNLEIQENDIENIPLTDEIQDTAAEEEQSMDESAVSDILVVQDESVVNDDFVIDNNVAVDNEEVEDEEEQEKEEEEEAEDIFALFLKMLGEKK